MSHEYSDYTLVNELYNRGFEIGLNSISHQSNQEYWRYASEEVLMSEFNDQRDQIAHFANIPASAIQGLPLTTIYIQDYAVRSLSNPIR